MKRKSIIFFALVLSILVALSGCSSANNDDVYGTPDYDMDEYYEKYPDEDQIKADLMGQNANCFNIAEEDTYLNIETIEITRRKSDKQYDEVYVTSKLSNGYYGVNAEYVLSYSFYDVGGWCLDYFEVIDYQSYIVSTPITNELLEQVMIDEFTTCTITNRVQSTDSQGIFYDNVEFAATLEYPYLTVSLDGNYTMSFYNNCWHESVSLETAGFDWSSFIGTFIYESHSFYSEKATVDISDVVQISEKELQVTYSGSSSLYDLGDALVDETVGSRTEILQIEYKTITIMGVEVQIPYSARSISLPWAYGDSLYARLYYDAGIKMSPNQGTYQYQWTRIPSDKEVQSAIDKLNEMNGIT